MLTRRLIGAAIIAAPMFTFPVHAATVSLSIDNDGVIGTDREYTSGLFLRWSSDPGLIGYSIEIGQQMWTPSDIELTEPLPNERAYAGFLYTQARLYQQTDTFALKGGCCWVLLARTLAQKLANPSFTLSLALPTHKVGTIKSMMSSSIN